MIRNVKPGSVSEKNFVSFLVCEKNNGQKKKGFKLEFLKSYSGH